MFEWCSSALEKTNMLIAMETTRISISSKDVVLDASLEDSR